MLPHQEENYEDRRLFQIADLSDLKLPEVAAFSIEGRDVSKQLAAEIILRTLGGPIRDRFQLVKELALKLPNKRQALPDVPWEIQQLINGKHCELRSLWNSLDMESVGWIDWNGRILENSSDFKETTALDLFKEWEKIANAFPDLDLQCQVFDGPNGQGAVFPVVEYEVYWGKVVVRTKDLKPMPLRTNHKRFIPDYAYIASKIAEFAKGL